MTDTGAIRICTNVWRTLRGVDTTLLATSTLPYINRHTVHRTSYIRSLNHAEKSNQGCLFSTGGGGAVAAVRRAPLDPAASARDGAFEKSAKASLGEI